MKILNVCTAKSIAASGTFTLTVPFDVSLYAREWTFAAQIIATGTGTVTVQYRPSMNGTFITPVAGSNIWTDFSASSGPGTDGNDLITFSPPLCRYMNFLLTETGTSAAVVVSLWIAVL